jgi:hypothetical protein
MYFMMNIDQFILLCNRLSMDDKLVVQDVKEAYSLCRAEKVFVMENINQSNWLRYRNNFLRRVSFNEDHNHDAIMIVLYWFRQFNEIED